MFSCFSHVQLIVTPWSVAQQAALSMGFSRQEYWRGLPCPPPGNLPDPEIKAVSLASPALATLAESLPPAPPGTPPPPFHPYTGLVQHPVPLSQPHYHQDCVTRVPRCLGKGFPLCLLRRQPRECCSSHHVQCKGSGSDSTHRTSPNGKGAE